MNYTMTWFDRRLKQRGLTTADLFGDKEAIEFVRYRQDILSADQPLHADNNGHDCDCEYCDLKRNGYVTCPCGTNAPIRGEKEVRCSNCKTEMKWEESALQWLVKQPRS